MTTETTNFIDACERESLSCAEVALERAFAEGETIEVTYEWADAHEAMLNRFACDTSDAEVIVVASTRPHDNALWADESIYGWSVRDACGGVWTPNDDAANMIAASDSPAATAVALCDAEPTRGVWTS